MRIYDMRCLHDLCGRVFDWHIKPAIYERSSKDGKYAIPGLKGKSYYGKEERDRLLKAAGSSFADDGSSRDCGKKKEVVNETQRDRARSAIEKLLDKNGQMRLKDIISESGLGNSAVNDVIYKDPGRIIKTGWGLYGLSGVEYETGASAS